MLSAPAPLQIPLDNVVTRHEYPYMPVNREHLHRCLMWLHTLSREPLIVQANSVAHNGLARVIGTDNVNTNGVVLDRALILHLYDETRKSSVSVELQLRHILEFVTNMHAELMADILANNTFRASSIRSWLDGMSRALQMCVVTLPLLSPNQEPLPVTLGEYALSPFYLLPHRRLHHDGIMSNGTRQGAVSPAVRLLTARMYATSMFIGIRDLCPWYLEGIKEMFCQVACGGKEEFPPPEKKCYQTFSWMVSATDPLIRLVVARAEAIRRVYTSVSAAEDRTSFMSQCSDVHSKCEKERKLSCGVTLCDCILSAQVMEDSMSLSVRAETRITSLLIGHPVPVSTVLSLLVRDLQFHSYQLLNDFSEAHKHRVFPLSFYHRSAHVSVVRKSVVAYLLDRKADAATTQFLLLRTRDRYDDLPVTILVCTESALPSPGEHPNTYALVADINPAFLPGSLRSAVKNPLSTSSTCTPDEWDDVVSEASGASSSEFEYALPRIKLHRDTSPISSSPPASMHGVPMWDELPKDSSALSVQFSRVPVPTLAPMPLPQPTSNKATKTMTATRRVALQALPNLAPVVDPFQTTL